MSFFQNFDEENVSFFHFDKGIEESFFFDNYNNTSNFNQSNIFDFEKYENLNIFNAKEAKNDTDLSNIINLTTPSYLEENLSKNKNEEINGQIYEESIAKSIYEINPKNYDNKNERPSKPPELLSQNNNSENLNNSKSLNIKLKIKNGKNEDILIHDNSPLMNSFSEKLIRYYLEKGKGQNIDYFFRNYLKSLDTKQKNFMLMILSSNEFISKSKKYKHKEKATSFFDKDESFLTKKRKQLINDKINLTNILIKKEDKINELKKEDQFKIPFLFKNQSNDKNKDLSLSSSFNRSTKCDISSNYENKIKIINNKIIDEKGSNKYLSNDLQSNENIDYERIFYNQFINKCPFRK